MRRHTHGDVVALNSDDSVDVRLGTQRGIGHCVDQYVGRSMH